MNEPLEPQGLGDVPEVSITLLSLGPSCPPRLTGSISEEGDVLTGSRLFKGLRSCWELNQDDDCATSVEMFVFTLSGNSLGPLLAACVFIYYLFINHKSGKDLRKLIIKDTNTVKLLKQNTALEAFAKRQRADQGKPPTAWLWESLLWEGCRSCPAK